MKRFFSLFLALALGSSMLMAQTVNPQQAPPLQNDPSVRIGKLDNGMTYYIKHNAKPEQRADFHLVTHVGALQENERQNGLAHFLEHMCLNGTKNFPGNSLISYFESIGCRFGANINAGTGVESTDYMLNNIPMIREGILDSCLLVMHDYAHFVTLDPAEIDKERGIILEELRTRNTADWRIYEQSLAYRFKGSKYATTNVIGDVETLKNFPASELKDFYTTWYRPDNQAVIVVGDIDVDQVEAKLKALMADIPAPTTPNPRQAIAVPHNEEPIVGIVTDPETTASNIILMFKSEPMPTALRNTAINYSVSVLKSFVSGMFNDRIQEIAQEPDAPFLGGGMVFAQIAETCDATFFVVNFKDGEGQTAYQALLEEVEKMKRYGFTEAELERAKTNLLRGLERRVANAKDMENSSFVGGMSSHFLHNNPILTPEYELQLAQSLMPAIQLAYINQLTPQLLTQDNRVVIYTGPRKEGVATPTEAELLAAMDAAAQAQVSAYEETVSDAPLVDEAGLTPGSVVATEEGPFGSTCWTLSNGVKVYVKPTDFKADQVLISGQILGGVSLLNENLYPLTEGNIFRSWMGSCGLASFSPTELGKKLTGIIASMSPFLNSYTHGFNGSASPQDIETALQLLYAMVKTPRFEEKDFQTMIGQLSAVVPNLSQNPNFAMQEHLTKLLYNNHPARPMISMDLLSKVSLQGFKDLHKTLFAQVDDMKLFFVGNIDPQVLKPLVEKYVASLPTTGAKAAWRNDGVVIQANKKDHFTQEMTTPKTSIFQIFTTPKIKYNAENDMLVDAYRYILDMSLTETLREDEGGTYGASVQVSLTNKPQVQTYLLVGYDTDPERYVRMREVVSAAIAKLAKEGPDAEEVKKAQETMVKEYEEALKQNGYWNSVLQNYIFEQRDFYNGYLQRVEKLVNAKNIQKIAKIFAKINAQDAMLDLMMNPAPKAEAAE